MHIEAHPSLAAARAAYRYKRPDENEMAPICMAASWPWLEEQYAPSWIVPFLPTWLGAQAWRLIQRVRSGLERATFRFDKLSSYGELFVGSPPSFTHHMGDEAHDAAFGWWRIAGANALLLRRERDLAALRTRIPLPVERIEARLRNVLGRPVSLAD